jgi:hypothetical protein
MLFSDVLRSLVPAPPGDAWIATIPSDWLQGRSAFGGLQAALALRAMRALAPADPLRVLQTTFIAPVLEGSARLEARVLRAGKSTVHAEARIFSGGDLAAIVIAVFGKRRPSEIQVVPLPPALPPSPTPLTPLDRLDLPAGLPVFLQHFQMRWLRGMPPGAGDPSREAILEVGIRDPGAAATEAHVIALADMPPPIALSMLKARVPASSLTWTLEMLGDGADRSLAVLPLSGWRLDVAIEAGEGGYTSQVERVWGPGGEAVALSRQCMVVFG